MRVPFLGNKPNYKEESLLELQKNSLKEAYTITIYLSKTNLEKKTTQHFLGNWQIHLKYYTLEYYTLEELSKNA